MKKIRVLYTSDIHADSGHLFRMLKTAEKERVDGIVIGGDIVPHHLPDENELGMIASQGRYLRDVFVPAVEEFGRRRDVAVYLDMANDDFACNRKILEDRDGELYNLLHMRKHQLSPGVDLVGYMVVPPTPFQLKDREKPDSSRQPYAPGNPVRLDGFRSRNGRLEATSIDPDSPDTIESDLKRLSRMIDRPFLFVSHCPPYDTPLDLLYNGLHAGSISIRRFIGKWAGQGMLIASFHGHIHESPTRSGSISTTINNTSCVNPGQGSGRNADFRYVVFQLLEGPGPPRIELDRRFL